MLTQSDRENQLKSLKPIIFSVYNVKSLGYFGSFALGEENESSDIDILVEFQHPAGWEFFELEEMLEKVFQRKIDMVTPNGLKPQLRNEILSSTKYI